MLALRFGERAVPLAWRIEATEGAIGFETQKALLEAVAPWLPEGARVRLMGDRFYGTANLIGWCQERTWDYRLRLKGNLTVFDGETTTTAACAEKRTFYLEDVELTARRVRTHIGIIHDPGHPEPWIIAMSDSRATCAPWTTARGGASSHVLRLQIARFRHCGHPDPHR